MRGRCCSKTVTTRRGPNNGPNTYGRCARCQADIAFDRLRAKPWATLCLDCANAQERAKARTG